MITRRKFVACVACCAAVAGKLAGQEVVAVNNENLVTSCGTYCGACPIYLDTRENSVHQRMTGYMIGMGMKPQTKEAPKAKEGPSAKAGPQVNCDGCLGGGRVSGHVPKCAIRECAAAKTKTRHCSECAEFPCSRITDFNDDGVLHHAIVLENLRQLRTMGIKDWAKYEADRWSCPKCGTPFSWYDPECPKCKAPRPDKLFPLKKA